MLDITSLSEIGGGADGDAGTMNRKIKNLLANLPEDLRISKLLRQLSNEKDAMEARKICAKLTIVVLDQTNAGYMRRSFEALADTFLRIFKDCPSSAAMDVADVFGKMGWMVRSEFSMYRNCIARMYKHERTREYALRALLQTLKMDIHARDIRPDNCNRIMEMLKENLERVEKPEQFIAITNVIRQFAQNYPKQFDAYFADIVDIIIGWHLETEQLLSVKQHCSMTLQSFKTFWLTDVSFTQTLLNQFLEDIVSYRDEIAQNEAKTTENQASDSSPTPEICFGSIVGATNSILKCIYDSPAVLCQHIGIDLLNDIVRSVLEMIQAFESIETHRLHYSIEQRDVIYMYVNELIVIALDCRKIGVNIPEELLLSTITHQLDTMDYEAMPTSKIMTCLFVVYKIIAELKSNIALSFIQLIVGGDSKLHTLKFAHNQKVVSAYIRIYQTIMGSKNVEILQETYRHIVIDLGVAIDALKAHNAAQENDAPIGIYNEAQANLVICFYLATISKLATATSSIIVMWVLEPNILELLAERLESADSTSFWHKSPETHHAIIVLLISHCRNNNNFITSSSLLSQEINKITDVFSKITVDDGPSNFSNEFVPGASSFVVPASTRASQTESSPTANHFELILKYLRRVLGHPLNTKTTLLLLQWCECIIGQTIAHANILMENPQFLAILKAINRIASDIYASEEVHLKVADCFGALLNYNHLDLDQLEWIAETCCVKMCAGVSMIRDRYSHLFGRLPLNVALKQAHQFSGVAQVRQQQINGAQHWYLRTPTPQRAVEMRSQFFADFICSIKAHEKSSSGSSSDIAGLGQYHQVESIFQNIFTYSQCHETKTKTNEMIEFEHAIRSDIRVLMFWVQNEAAQSCVNNKLRTALGKPQETFTKIESTIKEIARLLAIKEKTIAHNIDTILANQRHARIWLGFMECLEKYIYNASEGMAIAMPPMEKPVRTFFRVNATTCNEWFNRIRPAVDIVGSHCMEPEMVIRYTESVLKNLVANGKVAEPIFEHTLITHALALLRNKESDALLGLFEWTRSVAKKKFPWIKLVAGENLQVLCDFFEKNLNFSLKNLNFFRKISNFFRKIPISSKNSQICPKVLNFSRKISIFPKKSQFFPQNSQFFSKNLNFSQKISILTQNPPYFRASKWSH